MLQLLQLLLRERWRKLRAQYGWAACLSVGLLLLLGAWWLGALVDRFVDGASIQRVGSGSNMLWASWIVAGVLTGKDLTWHLRLERLTFFPLSFGRLYTVTLILGFLSFPLLLGLGIVLEVSSFGRDLRPTEWPIRLIAYGLLIYSVRLLVSLVRTALYRGSALRKPVRSRLWMLIVCVAAAAMVPLVYSRAALLLPGYQFALVLLGIPSFRPLLLLAAAVLFLAWVDYAVQRDVVFQGMTGPPAMSGLRKSKGIFHLFRPSPSATLWCMSLLGWLRNRNALLVWIWGLTYGFAYLYFSKVRGQSSFMLFCWMVLIFHGYLRGNLFGVDRQGTWLYFMVPIPIERTIRAKNSTLNVLQMCLVGAVLLPAVLQITPGMTTPIEWLGVLSFACSAILLGEGVGSVFSVLHPEPIERSSRYSGGTTVGALVIPLLQALLLGIFIAYTALAPRFLTPFVTSVPLILVPVWLWIARFVVLRVWVQKRMTDERETILRKLSAFST